jgi:DNA invertase Pin-like site-specific DNA recombinase
MGRVFVIDSNPTHPGQSIQMARQYLTTRQVARTLGVSLNTIYRWLKAEKIPEPYRNPENNYRLWTVEDLSRIRQFGPERQQQQP